MAKTKKAATAKTPTAKATTKTNSNGNGARLTRARSVINTIAKQLTKGATVVEHSVRCTLKHPQLPKGVVAACFARQNHVVVLLPALGAMLKVKGDPDRNNTPFETIVNGDTKAAVDLGKRIAKALKA